MRTIALRTLLFVFMVLSVSPISFAQVRISIAFGPSPIPVYEQPVCPGDGYVWTPGYWAWDADDGDYYWVPGTWVLAPEVGFLWTPPYWAWDNGAFVFHDGYWGHTLVSMAESLTASAISVWVRGRTLGRRSLLL
jgi:hypothetical protein